MDAVPCTAFHPTPFPIPLREVAASTSLPESKWKLFLQPYLAGLQIFPGMLFFLGCSGIFWRGVAAVTLQCQGPRSDGNHSPRSSSPARLQGLILSHKCSLWHVPRHSPSPQGWLETEASIPWSLLTYPQLWWVTLQYKWLRWGSRSSWILKATLTAPAVEVVFAVLSSSSCSLHVSRPDGETAADADAEVGAELWGKARPSLEPSNGIKM